MPPQMWSLLVLLVLVIIILVVLLPQFAQADVQKGQILLMGKPTRYCKTEADTVSLTKQASRNEPFLVERMAIAAGADSKVALEIGKAYRNCNPNDLPASDFIGVIKTESNFNPKELSEAGAKGIMQLMPSTFQTYTEEYPELFPKKNIFDTYENACAGLLYLNDNYEAWLGHVDNSTEAMDLAIASYLMGVGKLKSSGYSSKIYDGDNFVSYYLERVKKYGNSALQTAVK
jgi:soluble lytic murein transglycosylase-like protein